MRNTVSTVRTERSVSVACMRYSLRLFSTRRRTRTVTVPLAAEALTALE